MKKITIALLAAILFGTATASLYAASPTNQPSGQETEEEPDKPALAERAKSAGTPICTPQDAAGAKDGGQPKDPENTADRNNHAQTKAPENIPANAADDTQGEFTDQTQEETPEGLPAEDTPAAPAPTSPESLIPPDSESTNKQYKILKNSLFPDNENFGVKKIVTESFGNGSFLAEDLGTWLKKQEFYHISVAEEDGPYKTLYYKANLEAQEREEEKLASAEDAAPLSFAWLVEEGDIITNTDTCIEAVTSVEPDGSFYTTYSLCQEPEEK